ncbi:WD40 repeat protein [Lutibacter sp. Hel_I_33_5]|uniref:OmpA family protein n=1 Tax=Lutibacter sp. Hel_I_33_5 TaxID=1566289 RepID=UPI00119D2DFF|nr:OmpA family protein [Lutibacter sp. Hel_I_33_5]TVZ55677.1 WD40 repeat protein [Lutibacter sp. Hel_I_33_5]
MKKISTLCLLFIVVVSFGQRKYAANKYFSDYSYVKSAKLYEELFKRGDTSKLVVTRLADSYYFNNKTVKAETWYKKLFELYRKDTLQLESYFRYAQVLKSNGNYKESDKILLEFRKLNNIDSRGKKLIENKNYFDTFSKDKDAFRSIHNLSVNTKYSDYGAYVHNGILYFSSTKPKTFGKLEKKYHWNNQPFYNIYKADQVVFDNEKNINFTDIENETILKEVNSQYHDSNAIITNDGKTMYFTRDDFDGKKLKTSKRQVSQLKIYRADFVDSKWTNITELPFNSSEYSTRHPALSSDNKTLYFVSEKPGGFGKTDIYKVSIHEDGTYGNPINLGKEINTEGIEMFPFIGNDNTLYFSSNGHIGLGGLDVFESNLNALNEYNGVSNLGVPINSQKDDFSFYVNKEQKTGYFSSNREGGKGDDDIYSFIVNEKEKPCNVKIVGQVKDKVTNELLVGASVTLFDKNNLKVDSLRVGKDARFEFILPCNENYKLIGKSRYYKPDNQIFYTEGSVGVLNAKKMDLRLNDDFRYSDKLEMILNIKPIYFDLDKATIRPDATKELDRVVLIMNKYPEIEIRASSHTDSRGNDAYNQTLSEKRAISTREYIVSKGISASRISAKGFGENKLVNNCSNTIECSDDEHQKNRRTEFVVVKKM